MSAVNAAGKPAASRTREDMRRSHATRADDTSVEAVHPVDRTHQEAERKALYVNVAHTVRFEAMTAAQSAPLLNDLFSHQITPEFTCRFQWQPGSLAFWDNRASLHYPLNDYHGHRRVMHRVTIAGNRPR